MNEDDLQEFRRRRLASWLADHGGLAQVIQSRRLKPSYQSFLSQVVNGLSFGSRAARTCEERLGMPPLWLDQGALGDSVKGTTTVVFTNEPQGGQRVARREGPAPTPWPHAGLTLTQWQTLTEDERLELDGALLSAYAQLMRRRRERDEQQQQQVGGHQQPQANIRQA